MATRSRRQLRAVQAVPEPDLHREAFDVLYGVEWSGIVALGWSLTGSWGSAEELAQDAFADAYRRWDDIGRLDKPGAWVRRAVINRAASYHRARGAEDRGLERWANQAEARSDRPHSDRTGDSATERVGDPAFWAAVRSLPERQMACVALHYLEDRPVAEIAEVLDCRPATVKVHLHRGRLALAERLSALDESARGSGSGPTGHHGSQPPPNDGSTDTVGPADRPTHDRGEEA